MIINTLKYLASQSSDSLQADVNQINNNTLPKNNMSDASIQNVLAIVFAVAAAVSVLMIVIAGFRLIAGEGNPEEVSKAKSTILYAIVGLFVSLSAEAIVAFVLTR